MHFWVYCVNEPSQIMSVCLQAFLLWTRHLKAPCVGFHYHLWWAYVSIKIPDLSWWDISDCIWNSHLCTELWIHKSCDVLIIVRILNYIVRAGAGDLVADDFPLREKKNVWAAGEGCFKKSNLINGGAKRRIFFFLSEISYFYLMWIRSVAMILVQLDALLPRQRASSPTVAQMQLHQIYKQFLKIYLLCLT